MLNKIFKLVDRVKEKWLLYYRLSVFRGKTGQRAERCSILGRMTQINTNIRIGKHVTFYPDIMLFGDGEINIGSNVDIGNNCILYAKKPNGGITIGSNTMIAAQCYIIDSDHGMRSGMLMRDQELQTKKIEIGEDVWIGANCQILKGAQIGNGAVIGAGSVVIGKIPPNAIACGSPARVKKYRE